MAALTRFWLVGAGSAPELGGEAPFDGLALGRVVAAGSGDGALALSLARGVEVSYDAALEALALRPAAERRSALGAFLDRWASVNPGQQVAIVAPEALVHAAAALALEVEGEPVRGRTATLDWPLDEHASAALVGVDLDWVPPFAPDRRTKFPGGPGAAASGR